MADENPGARVSANATQLVASPVSVQLAPVGVMSRVVEELAARVGEPFVDPARGPSYSLPRSLRSP
jgi:hypothetical protein